MEGTADAFNHVRKVDFKCEACDSRLKKGNKTSPFKVLYGVSLVVNGEP